jgi:origin recognition complex subunit 1
LAKYIALGKPSPARSNQENHGQVCSRGPARPRHVKGKHQLRDGIIIDGQQFRVGENVYVILDERVLAMELDGSCPPQSSAPAHASEVFLQRQGLGLARIDSIWRNSSDGELCFTGTWYNLPEETHVGRQSHHGAREVFLSSNHQDPISFGSVLRKASILSKKEFDPGVQKNDDLYLCEYEYDATWQRFRRHMDWGNGQCNWFDEGWAQEEDYATDDENKDATYTIVDALRAEYGHDFRHHSRGYTSWRRKSQGGHNFEAKLGIGSIPAHIQDANIEETMLRRTCRALALAAAPPSLPCREDEHETITSFVKSVLSGNGNGGKCLYVSGIPGTGKTATVLDVMQNLHRSAKEGEIPSFQFVEINGLRLPSPQHAYSALFEALTGNCVGPATAARQLETMFAERGRAEAPHTIVLLDEMDSLINRTQTVLYNLFDWPSRPGSRLSIIGVANTMDLPERLHPRIGSRLAGTRLVFHPYQRAQLETIMQSRLQDCGVFDANAIGLVTRKVANCSGDVRRCLELCRRAAEIATERHAAQGADNEVKVTIRDVDTAIREAFNTPQLRMIRHSPLMERLLLAAVHLESRYAGRCEVSLEGAYNRYVEMDAAHGRPQFSTILECVVSMAERKLLVCEAGHRRLAVKVALNVRTDDLIGALSDDPELTHLADRLK